MARDLSPADCAFRDEVRHFLDRELSADLRLAGRRTAGIFTDYDDGQRWFRILADELAAAGAPVLAPQGARMVAPVVLAFGTPEQKAQWLPAIRAGDDYWCQGYSEPGAGSDLASLQCRAVRLPDAQGGGFVINGTKIWTTHAQWANKIFCLVRTDSSGKAQQGISFLLFDMGLPGITVRPIISLSGDHELNQVFFDDVRVPATALLGEEHRGWTIAKYLLVHERGGSYTPMLRARLARLQAAWRQAFADRPADDDERRDCARVLADAECRIDALHALEQQVQAARLCGDELPAAPSIGKLLGTELKQLLTEIGVSLAGAYGAARLPLAECAGDADLADHALAVPEDAVFAMSAYLNDRAASLYAGTNEVQRNLIAQQLLAN